jgi:hypothetical protein
MQPPEMRTTATTFAYVLSDEWNGEPFAWGIGKSPLWAMAATSPALIVQTVGTENSQDWRANGAGRFGNMEMNHSRPYELTEDVSISIPRVVRVVRTIRIGLSKSAKAWRPLTDTSTTKSKESSFRIGAFAINHPIVAMLVLGLIALIGFVCIFELPIGWLPF